MREVCEVPEFFRCPVCDEAYPGEAMRDRCCEKRDSGYLKQSNTTKSNTTKERDVNE